MDNLTDTGNVAPLVAETETPETEQEQEVLASDTADAETEEGEAPVTEIEEDKASKQKDMRINQLQNELEVAKRQAQGQPPQQYAPPPPTQQQVLNEIYGREFAEEVESRKLYDPYFDPQDERAVEGIRRSAWKRANDVLGNEMRLQRLETNLLAKMKEMAAPEDVRKDAAEIKSMLMSGKSIDEISLELVGHTREKARQFASNHTSKSKAANTMRTTGAPARKAPRDDYRGRINPDTGRSQFEFEV